jgi:hypothetical protein
MTYCRLPEVSDAHRWREEEIVCIQDHLLYYTQLILMPIAFELTMVDQIDSQRVDQRYQDHRIQNSFKTPPNTPPQLKSMGGMHRSQQSHEVKKVILKKSFSGLKTSSMTEQYNATIIIILFSNELFSEIPVQDLNHQHQQHSQRLIMNPFLDQHGTNKTSYDANSHSQHQHYAKHSQYLRNKQQVTSPLLSSHRGGNQNHNSYHNKHQHHQSEVLVDDMMSNHWLQACISLSDWALSSSLQLSERAVAYVEVLVVAMEEYIHKRNTDRKQEHQQHDAEQSIIEEDHRGIDTMFRLYEELLHRLPLVMDQEVLSSDVDGDADSSAMRLPTNKVATGGDIQNLSSNIMKQIKISMRCISLLVHLLLLYSQHWRHREQFGAFYLRLITSITELLLLHQQYFPSLGVQAHTKHDSHLSGNQNRQMEVTTNDILSMMSTLFRLFRLPSTLSSISKQMTIKSEQDTIIRREQVRKDATVGSNETFPSNNHQQQQPTNTNDNSSTSGGLIGAFFGMIFSSNNSSAPPNAIPIGHNEPDKPSTNPHFIDSIPAATSKLPISPPSSISSSSAIPSLSSVNREDIFLVSTAYRAAMATNPDFPATLKHWDQHLFRFLQETLNYRDQTVVTTVIDPAVKSFPILAPPVHNNSTQFISSSHINNNKGTNNIPLNHNDTSSMSQQIQMQQEFFSPGPIKAVAISNASNNTLHQSQYQHPPMGGKSHGLQASSTLQRTPAPYNNKSASQNLNPAIVKKSNSHPQKGLQSPVQIV